MFGTENNQEDQQEDEPPVPMTTRLRKQAERAREKEREMKQRITDSISISDGEEGDIGCPTQWNVEQVFSYISSLPGTTPSKYAAEEFSDGKSRRLAAFKDIEHMKNAVLSVYSLNQRQKSTNILHLKNHKVLARL